MDAAMIYLDSSDDEGEAPPQLVRSQKSVEVKEEPGSSRHGQGSSSSSALVRNKGKGRLVESRGASLCRQFWQAGNYEDHPPKRRRITPGSMDHVRVHPKFLHSNATSHKWALGAIAELLDNSVDEIANGATFCFVDKIVNPRDGEPALLIQDDGGGMTPDALRQCMSLGFSEKNGGGNTIGQYGNGFKTSTMRLGADVLVLTRKESESGFVTQSAGLLSYTFLRKSGHEDIIVPSVDYKLLGAGVRPTALVRSDMDDWLGSLATITRWSPYSSEDELLEQFGNLGSRGTKVIIFNLWHDEDNNLELDFDTDPHDIQLRVIWKEKSKKTSFHTALIEDHISHQYRYSLRAYSSILYLEIPQNFRIILRGKIVEHRTIVSDMKYVQYLKYKPQFGKEKEKEFSHKDVSVVTTVGFTKEAPMLNVHGYSVYHKNRLIMPFWKVFHDNSSRGRGVVGVLEVNFIEPAHDKQDFERTAVFIKLETRLKQITMEYWKAHCHLLGYKPGVRPVVPVPRPMGASSSHVGAGALRIGAASASHIGAGLRIGAGPSHIWTTAAAVPVLVAESPPPEAFTWEAQATSPPPPDSPSEIPPTSGPSTTPEGLLGNKTAEGLDKVKVEWGHRAFKETNPLTKAVPETGVTYNSHHQAIGSHQAVPLANREPSSSMTTSPDNTALLAEILEQNTLLHERCVDFENREKHWELKIMDHEHREQKHLAKIAELENELLALKTVGQMQNLAPGAAAAAAHVDVVPPQDAHLPPPNGLKSEVFE